LNENIAKLKQEGMVTDGELLERHLKVLEDLKEGITLSVRFAQALAANVSGSMNQVLPFILMYSCLSDSRRTTPRTSGRKTNIVALQ
jgi:hypothetical protein